MRRAHTWNPQPGRRWRVTSRGASIVSSAEPMFIWSAEQRQRLLRNFPYLSASSSLNAQHGRVILGPKTNACS